MLSYNLTSYERAFTFRILSQDSAIKDAIASAGGSFVSSNGWTIQIARSPEIKVVSKRIYLRGSNKANDKRIDRTWNIPSNIKLHQILNQIDSALAEIISFAREHKDAMWFLNPYEPYNYLGIQYKDLPVESWATEAGTRPSVRSSVMKTRLNWYYASVGKDYQPYTYPAENSLPIVNSTSKAQIPFHIDARGWGNNKLKDIPTWESIT